jgi:hypothetical protein
MSDVGSGLDPEGTVSVAIAARELGITTREAVDLVFTRQLKTVAAPSGRRVVPLEVIEAWKREHAEGGTATQRA